jgi:hypothetical protein
VMLHTRPSTAGSTPYYPRSHASSPSAQVSQSPSFASGWPSTGQFSPVGTPRAGHYGGKWMPSAGTPGSLVRSTGTPEFWITAQAGHRGGKWVPSASSTANGTPSQYLQSASLTPASAPQSQPSVGNQVSEHAPRAGHYGG